jgi:PKHD-type hydroxylase
MLHQIRRVLSRQQVASARSVLAAAEFVDGKLSAGMAAERVKHNLEARRGGPDIDSLDQLVMGNLVRHPAYRNGALALRVAAPFYACYRQGMGYGDHVDDPVMGPPQGGQYRADIAITVFLSDSDEYAGGELVVRTSFGEQAVKLEAGDAVLYPAASLHRVTEVQSGERLVAVTWAQSLVRDPARRELLFELNQAREQLLRRAPQAQETAQVNHVYNNLVRMWGEM